MFRVVRDYDLWFLIQDAKRKKLIIYSEEKYICSLHKLLKNLDVSFAYFVTDEEIDNTQSVYDLILEDKEDIMVAVAKDNFDDAKVILSGIGLEWGVNFKNIKSYKCESPRAPYYYDPMCGFNLYTEGEECGFKIFGEQEKAENNSIKILTMGGSTTDAFLYPFKCWSEYLHELLNSYGVKNSVICGGVAGYSSAEELTKIIRDGIQYEPDIIINYSGCNDIKVGKYPYINSYMRQIGEYLEYLYKRKNIGAIFGSRSFGVTYGIDNENNHKTCYQLWLNNHRMIHAIAGTFGIKHLTIHQPNIHNGKLGKSLFERELIKNTCFCGPIRQPVDEFEQQAMEFKNNAKEDSMIIEWLEDFSDIFDYRDVYIDRLHVNEEGNKIIAENIVKLLINKGWI